MNIFRMENSCRKKMRKNLKRREKVQVLILILSGLDNFYKYVCHKVRVFQLADLLILWFCIDHIDVWYLFLGLNFNQANIFRINFKFTEDLGDNSLNNKLWSCYNNTFYNCNNNKFFLRSTSEIIRYTFFLPPIKKSFALELC